MWGAGTSARTGPSGSRALEGPAVTAGGGRHHCEPSGQPPADRAPYVHTLPQRPGPHPTLMPHACVRDTWVCPHRRHRATAESVPRMCTGQSGPSQSHTAMSPPHTRGHGKRPGTSVVPWSGPPTTQAPHPCVRDSAHVTTCGWHEVLRGQVQGCLEHTGGDPGTLQPPQKLPVELRASPVWGPCLIRVPPHPQHRVLQLRVQCFWDTPSHPP